MTKNPKKLILFSKPTVGKTEMLSKFFGGDIGKK